jgi:dihydrofolate reductase
MADRKLTYSMGISLDGFIAGPAGEIDWGAPGEELHRFHNEQTRDLGLHLCGRRLYETMVYWETADQDPSASEAALEFARIWQQLPKIVFSTTLDSVEGKTTLSRADPVDEVARLKAEPGREIAVGGARLASSLMQADLIDECRLFVSPVLVGGGTRFFPPLNSRLDFELVETRTFGGRTVYLRYARV